MAADSGFPLVLPLLLVAFVVAGSAFPAPALAADDARAVVPRTVRVVVWDEQQPEQKTAYDNFLGNAIADHLRSRPNFSVRSVKLDDPGQGVSDEVLDGCDVLVWWGHRRHNEISPQTGRKIVERIKAGKLALVALHSAHWSQPFVQAMNERTTQDTLRWKISTKWDRAKLTYVEPPSGAPKKDDPLTPSIERKGGLPDDDGELVIHLPRCVFPSWRADGKPSHVTTVRPDHPIAAGLPRQWDVKQTEMYDEPFHVPPPDLVIFEERWDAGEHFRSGCLWNVGKGLVFYFRPGHETYPVYRQPEPLRVIENACRWLGSQPPKSS
jgi:trehalose utilization protein